MNDTKTTLDGLKKKVDAFLLERDWHQFHDPRADSMGLSVEAAELMELFLYNRDPKVVITEKREAVEDEIADVLTWVLIFANTTGIDLTEALEKKMAKNAAKYPVEKCKGKQNKYNDL